MASDDAVLAFSAFRVALNAGALLAPLLAAAAIAQGWWGVLFALDAATCLAAAALVAGGSAEPRPALSSGPESPADPTAPVLRSLVTSRRLLYLAAMATSGIAYCQTYSVLPLQLDAVGHPAALYAGILSVGAATLVLLELPVTAATRHWPAPVAVFGGTLVFGLSFGLYAAAGVAALVVTGAVLGVAGTTISAPRLWSHPAGSPASIRPAFFAASQAAFAVGMAIGPVLGVASWQAMGRSWWAIVALVGVVSAVAGGLGTRGEEGRA